MQMQALSTVQKNNCSKNFRNSLQDNRIFLFLQKFTVSQKFLEHDVLEINRKINDKTKVTVL